MKENSTTCRKNSISNKEQKLGSEGNLGKHKRCPRCGSIGGIINCPVCHDKKYYGPKGWWNIPPWEIW